MVSTGQRASRSDNHPVGNVVDFIRQRRDVGHSVIIISHNMPNVFEVADRIHIQRLGTRIAIVNPKDITMSDAVAVMTGAKAVDPE